MKKIAVFFGAFGFLLMIGAAGGADGSSFGVTVLCEAIGITLLLASERLYTSKIKLRTFKKSACRTRQQKTAARQKQQTPICRSGLADMETA